MNRAVTRRRDSHSTLPNAPGIWQLQGVKSTLGWLVTGTALNKGAKPLRPHGRWWDVAVKTVRTYFLKPYRGKLYIRDDRQQFDVRTDQAGSFEFTAQTLYGQDLEVSVFGKAPGPDRSERIGGKLDRPGPTTLAVHDYPTHFDYVGAPTIVISDIDDTILVSKTHTFFSKLWLMLFRPVSKRNFVEETEQAYRKLDEAGYPFIYVSASELNLFSTISNFLRHKELPTGPIYLRPHRQWRKLWKRTSRPEYKNERIQKVVDHFPGVRFILFGDDSQNDPGVFKTITENNPGRIRGVFIRETGTRIGKKNPFETWTIPGSDIGVKTYSKFSEIEVLINLLSREALDRKQSHIG